MRFFTTLIALAVASVELGVLAAPAAQPNVNGLSAVSKNAVVKPKASRLALKKTAKRRTANNAVASRDAALVPGNEKITVIVHQLASDGRDPDDDGQDGDNDDAGDADAGDSDEAGGDDEAGDDEAGDDEAGDDEAGDDEAGDDEAGDDEAGDDEAGDDDNDNDDDP